MLFSAIAQIISWIGVGYNLKGHNWWAVAAFVALALFNGMVSMFVTAQNLNKMAVSNANSSKSQ